VLLSIGLEKTTAQVADKTVTVYLSEIRKANETKQRLDSCAATGQIILEEKNQILDSISVERAKNKVLLKKNTSITKKRNRWRIIGIVAFAVIMLQMQ
jgi:hypothetical protein